MLANPVRDLGDQCRARGMPPAPPPPPAHGAQGAGHADTAPSKAPAHRSHVSTPRDTTSKEAPTQGPPKTHGESDARATTPDTPKRATNQGRSPVGHNGTKTLLMP